MRGHVAGVAVAARKVVVRPARYAQAVGALCYKRIGGKLLSTADLLQYVRWQLWHVPQDEQGNTRAKGLYIDPRSAMEHCPQKRELVCQLKVDKDTVQ